jgi:predicted deoxyguanosinetriphosphate triphosphohydrolase
VENILKQQRRIIYSKPFRRLADKTQVMAKDKRDAQIRNRLTHSLEVANISREISINIGSILNYELDPNVCYNVGLIHDIGMSGLGHTAEALFHKVFSEKLDIYFEANANNLVIIEKDLPNLSPLTITSIIKYPQLITDHNIKGLYSDQFDKYIPLLTDVINQQNQVTSIPRTRTYECDIMELADDISYIFSDISDFLSIKFKNKINVSKSDLIDLFDNANFFDPDLFVTLTNIFENNDFESLESLRDDFIDNVYFCFSENSIKFKNPKYQKLLDILRIIEWDFYIAIYGASSSSQIEEKLHSMLDFLADNIMSPDIITSFIFSSSYKNKYLKAISENDILSASRSLLLSLSELTDTYLQRLVKSYHK